MDKQEVTRCVSKTLAWAADRASLPAFTVVETHEPAGIIKIETLNGRRFQLMVLEEIEDDC